MKQMIVNADDVGADESRNAGIFDAIKAGSVTSVSILPNGPALKDAVLRIRSLPDPGVSLGIHLNLSEGRPLTSGLRHIVGPDGNFLGKGAAQRLFAYRGGENLQKAIREEIDAQIQLMREFGFPIDHMDGHQHVHVFPAVAAIAAEAAIANQIRWLRIPEDKSGSGTIRSVPSAVVDEAHLFNSHAAVVRPIWNALGIRATDHFRGLYLKGHPPASHWVEFLDSIPDGLTELMVHPGYAVADRSAAGPFSGFSTPDREIELRALTDGEFEAAIQKSGVVLLTFADAGLAY